VSQRSAHARRGGGRLWRAYFQWRYAILFYSLLFTLAVGPLCSALGFRANLLELFLAINLLVAVLPIGRRRTRLLFLTIVVAVLAMRGGASWLDDTWLSTASLALWTVVALATLGYGDIVPRSEVTRGLAIMEAVVGQTLPCRDDRAAGGQLRLKSRQRGTTVVPATHRKTA